MAMNQIDNFTFNHYSSQNMGQIKLQMEHATQH